VITLVQQQDIGAGQDAAMLVLNVADGADGGPAVRQPAGAGAAEPLMGFAMGFGEPRGWGATVARRAPMAHPARRRIAAMPAGIPTIQKRRRTAGVSITTIIDPDLLLIRNSVDFTPLAV
jgi:hypothetical protein